MVNQVWGRHVKGVTGGQDTCQLETAYRFIKNFLDERKELFVLK